MINKVFGRLAVAALTFCAVLGSLPASAQSVNWPTKPVKFVVPFPPGFSALAWWGIFAPSGTPKPILDKFHAELVKALNQPDLRKTLTEQLGMDLVVSTPEALQKFLVGEIDRWGEVVRENNIRAD